MSAVRPTITHRRRRSMRILLALALVLGTAAPLAAQHHQHQHHPAQPYAGQETRRIKALSEAEIKGYLNGEGMGFARVAELNHYPGPRHVLDLAESLELTADQRRRTQALFEVMRVEAVRLGKDLVDKEAALERFFAEERTDEEELSELLGQIGAVRAALRGVHLRAHVAMRAVLSAEQITRYDELRGYSGEAEHSHHH